MSDPASDAALPNDHLPVEHLPDDHLPVDPDVEPQERVQPLRFPDLRRAVRAVLVERWDVLALISIGGALGSLARWGTSVAWPGDDTEFPWATLQVNVAGAALVGLLMVLVRRHGREGRYVRPFLGVGVLGGYTTFSTYALDVHDLLLTGQAVRAGLYLVGSVVLGLVAVWLGVTVGRLIVTAGNRRGQVRA